MEYIRWSLLKKLIFIKSKLRSAPKQFYPAIAGIAIAKRSRVGKTDV